MRLASRSHEFDIDGDGGSLSARPESRSAKRGVRRAWPIDTARSHHPRATSLPHRISRYGFRSRRSNVVVGGARFAPRQTNSLVAAGMLNWAMADPELFSRMTIVMAGASRSFPT